MKTVRDWKMLVAYLEEREEQQQRQLYRRIFVLEDQIRSLGAVPVYEPQALGMNFEKNIETTRRPLAKGPVCVSHETIKN